MNLDATIRRAQQGDVSAFEEIVSLYERKIYNFAYRMTRNREDAADLTQETLLRVWSGVRRFRGDSSFTTWIFRIASNVCTDRLRSRSRRLALSLDAPVHYDNEELEFQVEDGSAGPDELAEESDLKDAVRRAISQLPVGYRAVLVMRDIQGMSYKEISEVLMCPVGTVKSRLNRARLALREEMTRCATYRYLPEYTSPSIVPALA
ncbi:MAG: sigma-70 family RNA polymerase sigma factor [Bacillota bacterium]